MTNSTYDARLFLGRAWELEKQIRRLEELRVRMLTVAERGTSTVNAIRYSGTSARSRVEDGVCDYLAVKDEMDALIDKQVDVKREIRAVIQQVKGESCRKLLNCKYIEFKMWTTIARELKMNYSYVYKELRDKAERQIHNILYSS